MLYCPWLLGSWATLYRKSPAYEYFVENFTLLINITRGMPRSLVHMFSWRKHFNVCSGNGGIVVALEEARRIQATQHRARGQFRRSCRYRSQMYLPSCLELLSTPTSNIISPEDPESNSLTQPRGSIPFGICPLPLVLFICIHRTQ